MNSEVISLFIDDEMTLDDKIDFVETVHESRRFKDEAVNLLRQERLLRSEPVKSFPEKKPAARRSSLLRFLRPAGLAAAAAAAVAFIVLFYPSGSQRSPDIPYRFVLYLPSAGRVDITGSFTGWNAVPMIKAGAGGYWELTLPLSRGEHRFAYLLNGGERIADPTIPTREEDDFGGENTILSVGEMS